MRKGFSEESSLETPENCKVQGFSKPDPSIAFEFLNSPIKKFGAQAPARMTRNKFVSLQKISSMSPCSCPLPREHFFSLSDFRSMSKSRPDSKSGIIFEVMSDTIESMCPALDRQTPNVSAKRLFFVDVIQSLYIAR